MDIILRPLNLRWINDAADDPADFCVHGEVEFRVGGETLLDETVERFLALSAASLYLLRSLSEQHTWGGRYGEPLFPCCGHAMYGACGVPDVTIIGCSGGQDFEVLRRPAGDGVTIRAADGREWEVNWAVWRAAAFGFADAVSDFYAACSPKQVAPDDQVGYATFVAEWERRRGKVFGRRP